MDEQDPISTSTAAGRFAPRGRVGGRRRFFRRRVPAEGEVRPAPRASFYILPNLFTSASLFLALWAIVKVSEGNFVDACWLILAAAVCDAIDGPVARLTRTSSSFGLQFDSLADMVAFGVAPAFLMYSNLRTLDELLPNYAPRLALGACSLFAICSAIRLARFNVQASTSEKNHFTGLPTPGAAGVVVSAYLFVQWLERMPFYDAGLDARMLTRAILVLMVGISVLMVCEIPFPKFNRIILRPRNPFNTLVYLIVGACVLITFVGYFPLVLFAGFMLYIGATLAMALRRRPSASPIGT